MTTVSYIAATGFSLIVIAWCAVFIVMSYSRAAIRGAANRASRAGVVEYVLSRDSTRARQICLDRFNDDLSQALPSSVRSNISGDCSFIGNLVSVHVTGSLASVSAAIPNFVLDETTSRNIEILP